MSVEQGTEQCGQEGEEGFDQALGATILVPKSVHIFPHADDPSKTICNQLDCYWNKLHSLLYLIPPKSTAKVTNTSYGDRRTSVLYCSYKGEQEVRFESPVTGTCSAFEERKEEKRR